MSPVKGTNGVVRLYDAAFRLLAEQTLLDIRSAVFSPDGSKIAVVQPGRRDKAAKVVLLSARDLALLSEPDITGFSHFVKKAIFSDDGAQLILGSAQPFESRTSAVRIWDLAGSGKYRDLVMPRDILPLRSGEFAFCSPGPLCGVVDAIGQQKLCIGESAADTKGVTHLLVSPDGTRIRYELQDAFSLRERQFTSESSELLPARKNAPEFRITKIGPGLCLEGVTWSRKTGSGKKVRSGERTGLMLCFSSFREHVDSAVISPSAEFLLGGGLRAVGLFNRNGERQWESLTPSHPIALNIAANGRVAVVALRDQTIRWYRMSDGQELLAVFMHADGKRWVLWTPSGYYDCAPGAEDLIGWHVNNGEDKAADFYPVSRFRNTFYRPDVVAKILDTLDEKKALELADAEAHRKTETVSIEKILPPTVTILSPQFGDTVTTEEIEVRYTTRAPQDEPVTSVTARVDYRPVEGSRGVKGVRPVAMSAAGEQTMRVPIPRRDCVVSLFAENQHGISAAASVRLKWGGAAQQGPVAKPTLYAVVAGVSAYRMLLLQLGYAAKDAKDFATVLEKQKGGLYGDVKVMLLTDQKAMRDEVMRGLDWLRKNTTASDVAVMFLAGHGVNDEGGSYFFLPVNASPADVLVYGVRCSDIRDTLASVPGKALFFLDTCHAGNALGGRKAASALTRLLNESSSAEKGLVVFASCTDRQQAWEDARWGNGAFTKSLVDGFHGKAAKAVTGRITVTSLDAWLVQEVQKLTDGKQTPVTLFPKGSFEDFAVGMPLEKTNVNP